MCGVAGFIAVDTSPGFEPKAVLRSMTATLSHRGPDDEGYWYEDGSGLFLGFRRLSVQDLSPTGRQPMISSSGRYVIVFNGEIYNFNSLREELRASGASFRGRSDTEVILAAVERWGAVGALPRLHGMFAFALWDVEERALVLARDRMGEKPLYFTQLGRVLVFASELRALLAHPQVLARGNSAAAWHFLRYLYVPAPLSIIEGVEQLLPGTAVRFRIDESGVHSREDLEYWNLGTVAAGTEKLEDPPAALEVLHELLAESVRLRMVADVPVGALLSGGIDSSLVVALMQEQGTEPARTFTIRFDDPLFDEGPYAAQVAAELGARHTEVGLAVSQVRDLVPALNEISDEPMANPSVLPTLLVSEAARRDVVVALSGDGGDELFGGYNRYVQAARLIGWTHRMPSPFRSGLGSAIRLGGRSRWMEKLGRAFLSDNLGGQHTLSSRLARAAAVLEAREPSAAYRELMAVGTARPPISRRPGSTGPTVGERRFDLHRGPLTERMMLYDQAQYLPGDLLAKVDRASMWVSLEVRVPLLDHAVVEHAWSWPQGWLMRDGGTKWPLRQLLLRYLPRELMERPKMGFTVPIARWLQDTLAPWAEALLEPARLSRRGLWVPHAITELWSTFRAGNDDLALPLWTVLTLEAWCEQRGVEFGDPSEDTRR